MIIAGGSDFGKRARLAAINGLVAQSGGWRQLDYADPINAGLVGYWPLDGGSVSGTIAYDASGYGNNGTLLNSPVLVAGKTGQALSFNGTNQQLFASFTPAAATDNYSMCAWVNPSALPQNSTDGHPGNILMNGSNLAGYAMLIGTPGTTGSNFLGLLPAVAWMDSGYTFPTANAWYHVAMVRRSGTTVFYVNGLQTGSTYGTAPNAPSGGVFIGNAPVDATPNGINHLKGSVQGARIFNRAITASEIYRIYSDTSGNLGFETQGRRLFSFAGGLFAFLWNDTAASSDTLAGINRGTAAPTDTATTSETTAGVMLATATLPDTGATSETVAGVNRSTASLSDTASSTDAMTAFLVSVALLSDSLSSADLFALLNAGVYFFAWSDGLTVTDTTAGVGQGSGAVSDSAATSDGVTGFAVATALLSDGAATSELFAAIMRGAGLVSDTAASSDTPAGQAVAVLLDAAASTDAWQASAALAASLADAAGTSDTVSGTLAAVIAALNDAATSSDALAFVAILAKIKPFIVPVLTASTYRIARVASVNRTGSLSSVARIISA